jgi:hypothetical protein
MCWNILTMHEPINVKSPNNTNKWQMGFNSVFEGLSTGLVGLQSYSGCLGEEGILFLQLGFDPKSSSR